jgi:hypothetical protein
VTATLVSAAPAVAPGEPGLAARLAATDAAMTVRLETAGLAHDVNAAEPETVIDLADVVTASPAPAPVDLYPTPVAALLLRARARVLAGGWCRDVARDGSGGMCLTEAIRAEARTHQEEGEARILLRRALGGGDSIPEQNRRLGSATHAAAVLVTAAAMATQQGI